MNSGIYKITNTVNGKFYIGSAFDIEERWYRHKLALSRNNHHSLHLQRAWNKYGEDKFTFEVVELVDRDNLIKREQEYIDKLEPYKINTGYNISKSASNTALAGERNPNYGKHLSEETRVKISGAIKEHWSKYPNPNTGRKHTESAIKKMSEIKMGENNPMFGKKLSEKQRAVLLKANTGRFFSQETREKMSRSGKGKRCGSDNPFFGKTHDVKTREKMSLAKKGMYFGANNPNAKVVKQYSLNGDFVKEYKTLKDAINSFVPPANNIGDCCRGKTRQAQGYIWRYADESISNEVLF